MIGVKADVFEVVVFAAGADALLGVGGAGVGAFFLAEEDRLELVHAGVGEEQGWIVQGNDRRRWNESVSVLLDEEIEELLANLGGGHGCGAEIFGAGRSGGGVGVGLSTETRVTRGMNPLRADSR